MVLMAQAKLYKHPKAQTLYVTIPSKVVQDSTFAFKPGEEVAIRYDPKSKSITIEAIAKSSQKKSNRVPDQVPS